MRKTKKVITLVTLISIISTFAVGCGNEAPGKDNTTATTPIAEVTTPEPTTPAETTTQEPTTQEPSTEYVYKGTKFMVESDNKDYFVDLVVEKGHKFSVNDFMDKNSDDAIRGKRALDLVKALFSKSNPNKIGEFEDKYFEAGTTGVLISYSQNVVIEYDGDKKLCFHLVKENDTHALFDVYEID